MRQKYFFLGFRLLVNEKYAEILTLREKLKKDFEFTSCSLFEIKVLRIISLGIYSIIYNVIILSVLTNFVTKSSFLT